MDTYAGYPASSDAQRAITYTEFSDAIALADAVFWDVLYDRLMDAGVIIGDIAPDAYHRFRIAAERAVWDAIGVGGLTDARRAALCGVPAPAPRPERAYVTAFLSGDARPDVWTVTYDNGDARTFGGWADAYDALRTDGFRAVPGFPGDYWTRAPESGA